MSVYAVTLRHCQHIPLITADLSVCVYMCIYMCIIRVFREVKVLNTYISVVLG